MDPVLLFTVLNMLFNIAITGVLLYGIFFEPRGESIVNQPSINVDFPVQELVVQIQEEISRQLKGL